ncbi:GntR family transcriptional regulator [Methylobacterium terricola]|uniref:GntR family transcriptional regulator n=1 Tax=Methylobacterium terricola TaxID=2583531 RepID=A0A5C4L766_9HYPH|nr:GntR family transcriptional regulator [Methylobacterium terricola]TNC06200.1 GntR family transcriptional regulator [Methylobacterium terricola]
MPRAASQRRSLLANRILDLVRDARFQPGHHLREQALGDVLRVSRTPVRAALQLLAEQGVVEARRNHGFFLRTPPEDLHGLDVQAPSTSEDLYSRIVRDRLARRLPESFTQTDLARLYGVERSALARILARLLDDGLIHRNAGRGWCFPPTLDTKLGLEGSYDFRQIVEPAGLLMPQFTPDPALIERSRLQHLYLVDHPAIETVPAAQIFETDTQFHEMLIGFSGNPFLLQAIQTQNRLRRLLEFSGYVNRGRIKVWCREHLAILDAVSAGSPEEAARQMRLHLANALSASHHRRPARRGSPVSPAVLPSGEGVDDGLGEGPHEEGGRTAPA